jgi:hypothetical protein
LRGGDAPSARGEEIVCNITSKTQDFVKNDRKIEQKSQQYEEKQYLIRSPIFRYRSTT